MSGRNVAEVREAPAKLIGGRDPHTSTLSFLKVREEDSEVTLTEERVDSRPLMFIGLVSGDWCGEENNSYRNTCPVEDWVRLPLLPQTTNTLNAGLGEANPLSECRGMV